MNTRILYRSITAALAGFLFGFDTYGMLTRAPAQMRKGAG